MLFEVCFTTNLTYFIIIRIQNKPVQLAALNIYKSVDTFHEVTHNKLGSRFTTIGNLPE
jgi:hypothetical protein